MAEETVIIDDNGTQEPQENPEVKTYTQEEVMALLQKETDKRVSQALKTQEKKFAKQLSLSKLDDDAREKAEKDDRIAELEGLIAQMNVEKNKSELKSVLSSRGLSAEFADIINISDDIEASQVNIDKLDKLFKAAVKAEVEKRLAGKTPAKGSGEPTEMTKEQFMKLPLAQQNRIAAEQPELFAKFYN